MENGKMEKKLSVFLLFVNPRLISELKRLRLRNIERVPAHSAVENPPWQVKRKLSPFENAPFPFSILNFPLKKNLPKRPKPSREFLFHLASMKT